MPDWQVRLAAFVRERASVPFAWGSNDCALFAADCLQAITGEHLCPELRGHANARDAIATLRRAGGIRGVATRALGEPVSPAFARIGDVVAVQVGKREALAICNGGTAIAPGPEGIAAVSMKQARVAWRVG